jgi:acetyl-CoA carboxylase alpha subunit
MMKMLLLALICLLLTTTQALRVQSHDYGTMMTVAEFEKAQRKSTRPYIVEYISNTCDECNSLDVIDQ